MARPTLDREILKIRDDIVRMGSLVNKAIGHAYQAFQQQDDESAQAVIQGDEAINNLRYDVESRIALTMATQQPMAHDLRGLVASLIIANELERMGDHAEGVSRTVLRSPHPVIEVPPTLNEMTTHVREMLDQALQVYIEEAPERAQAIAEMDDRNDRLYMHLFDDVVQRMNDGKLDVEQGTYILWAGHALERIGDRITNICERVIYMSTGDIRPGLNPKVTELDDSAA